MTYNHTILSKSLSLHVNGAMNPAIHEKRWYAPLVPGTVISGASQSGKSSVSFESTTITADFTCWEAKTQVHNIGEVEAEIDKLVSLARIIFVERLAHTPTTGVQVEVSYKFANEEYDFPQLLRTKFPIFDMKTNENGATFFALWEAAESVADTTLQSRMWACNKSWHLHFAHIFEFSVYGKESDDFDIDACFTAIDSNKGELVSVSDRVSENVLGEVTANGVQS